MKLLLVEDEMIIRRGILRHIPWESLGIDEVLTATNGEEGLEAFLLHAPDIVLSDIRMPGMDGIQMCRAIRERSAEVKFVLITGYSQMDYLRSAIDLGAVGYVEKPLRMEELTRQLRKTIPEGTAAPVTTATATASAAATASGEVSPSPRGAVIMRSALGGVDPALTESAREGGNHSAIRGGGTQHNAVARACSYMEVHFRDPALSLQEIADAVFLTPTYLSAVFRRENGTTVGQYLMDIRMKEAVRLLEDPELQVNEIAPRCGFSDPNYFARAFRKQQGISPSEYRERSGQ